MMDPTLHTLSRMALRPLGAGDLIDRAVRLYRGNLGVFLAIAGPPVVIGALATTFWRMLIIALVGRLVETEDDVVVYRIFLWLGNVFIWFIELVLVLTVMGGASHNVLKHLAAGEPLSFSETYRKVRSRFWALLGAAILISTSGAVVGTLLLYLGVIGISLSLTLVATVFSPFPVIAFIVGTALSVGVVLLTGWLIFLSVSRIAFIPQAMLVEQVGFFASISRSFFLARGSTRNLAALSVFAVVASYSVLAILYVPIVWYAWVTGFETMGFDGRATPLWFDMAGQLVGQASLLITIPILISGLCLLYIDKRVAREGFDIEMMAARELCEVPGTSSASVATVPLQEVGG